MNSLISKTFGRIEEVVAVANHIRHSLDPDTSSPELETFFSRQTRYIIVPGFFERRSVFKGRKIPEGSAIFDYNTKQDNRKSAKELANFIDENYFGTQLQGIGYSMGGLILRYALQILGSSKYVKSFVTIATPHQGTFSPLFIPWLIKYPSCRQMLPGSDFLEELNSAPLGKIERVLCLRADGRDRMIFPQENAEWPSKDKRIKNKKVLGVNGHANILSNKTSWEKALEFLNKEKVHSETTGEFGYF